MDGLEKLESDLQSRSTPLLALETLIVLLNNMVAFFGNLLTLIVVLRSPRLRTIPNKFVISLAISDILMAIPSVFLSTSVLVISDWPFDQATCQFQGYYGITLAFASSETLALMSLNRYYRIVKPNRYRRAFTERRTSLMILAAWLIATLVQIPYVASGHRYLFHPGKIFCNQDGKEPFSTILVTVFGGIPMSIISFCSFKVFRSVRTHTKTRFRHVHSTRVNVEDIKVSRILLVMVLAYVICFSPVIVIEAIDFFSNGSFLPRQVYLFYTIAATMSSSVNPIIYGAMNRAFRQEYKRLLRLDRMFRVAPMIAGPTTRFLVNQLGNPPARTAHSPLATNNVELTRPCNINVTYTGDRELQVIG